MDGGKEGRKREVKWDFKSTFVLTDISQTTLRRSGRTLSWTRGSNGRVSTIFSFKLVTHLMNWSHIDLGGHT